MWTGARSRDISAVGLVLLVAIGGMGCQFKGKDADTMGSWFDRRDHWEIRPVEMRVFPSTRFRIDGDRPHLDARLELLDEAGDQIKGVGRLRFELFERDPHNAAGGRKLYHWDISMLTLEQNVRYYDPVTRTYAFPLELDAIPRTRRGTLLKVVMIQPDESRLEAMAESGPVTREELMP